MNSAAAWLRQPEGIRKRSGSKGVKAPPYAVSTRTGCCEYRSKKRARQAARKSRGRPRARAEEGCAAWRSSVCSKPVCECEKSGLWQPAALPAPQWAQKSYQGPSAVRALQPIPIPELLPFRNRLEQVFRRRAATGRPRRTGGPARPGGRACRERRSACLPAAAFEQHGQG